MATDYLPLIGAAVHVLNAVAAWLITYAIHSTLLIGTLLLLSAIPAGRRLAASHGSWLWRFALTGAFLTASLQSLRSESPLAGTLRVDRNTPARTTVRMEVTSDIIQGVSAPPSEHTVTRASVSVTPRWPLVLLGAWLAVAICLAGWFFIMRARFLHALGPRRDASHTLAGMSLRHLLGRTGWRHPVRLTLADRLTSPVALDGREICLPVRAMADLDPIRLESILAHELAHLVRRDPAWLTAARLIELVFFFQPLNRIARRRMQDAAEFASDAWASSRVARPLDLAHCLARVAEWSVAAPRVPVPAMAERPGSVLVRRVERLTRGMAVCESAPGRGARLAAVCALAALVFGAPRGAIGAERPSGNATFTARGPARGMVFVRHAGDSAAAPGEAEIVLVRASWQERREPRR